MKRLTVFGNLIVVATFSSFLAGAETVNYFECKTLPQEQAIELVAYPQSGLVMFPDVNEVAGTTVNEGNLATTFTNSDLTLSIYRESDSPTRIFSAILDMGTHGKVSMTCQLSSYDKPVGEGPGGVSVHN